MDVKECCFIHGLAILSNGLDVGLYFFDSLKTGIAFSESSGGNNDFFRLTIFEIPNSSQSFSGDTMTFINMSKTYH